METISPSVKTYGFATSLVRGRLKSNLPRQRLINSSLLIPHSSLHEAPHFYPHTAKSPGIVVPRDFFFPLFKLERAGIELIVYALFLNELFVAAAFDYSAVVENHDDVGVHNR